MKFIAHALVLACSINAFAVESEIRISVPVFRYGLTNYGITVGSEKESKIKKKSFKTFQSSNNDIVKSRYGWEISTTIDDVAVYLYPAQNENSLLVGYALGEDLQVGLSANISYGSASFVSKDAHSLHQNYGVYGSYVLNFDSPSKPNMSSKIELMMNPYFISGSEKSDPETSPSVRPPHPPRPPRESQSNSTLPPPQSNAPQNLKADLTGFGIYAEAYHAISISRNADYMWGVDLDVTSMTSEVKEGDNPKYKVKERNLGFGVILGKLRFKF